jgi:hypothetical protein
MRRIATLAAALIAAATATGAFAAPASAMVTPPQPDPIVIVDR